MGRTGRMWAVQHVGVQPDIVAVAKGIASGMPLGAIIAHEEIMNWPPGSHASTFGGNPVACAASLATLDLLEGGLIRNAATVGPYLMEKLREVQDEFPAIGDVRGVGLMVAADFVSGPAEPAGRPADAEPGHPGMFPPRGVALGLRRERHPFLPRADDLREADRRGNGRFPRGGGGESELTGKWSNRGSLSGSPARRP